MWFLCALALEHLLILVSLYRLGHSVGTCGGAQNSGRFLRAIGGQYANLAFLPHGLLIRMNKSN